MYLNIVHLAVISGGIFKYIYFAKKYIRSDVFIEKYTRSFVLEKKQEYIRKYFLGIQKIHPMYFSKPWKTLAPCRAPAGYLLLHAAPWPDHVPQTFLVVSPRVRQRIFGRATEGQSHRRFVLLWTLCINSYLAIQYFSDTSVADAAWKSTLLRSRVFYWQGIIL